MLINGIKCHRHHRYSVALSPPHTHLIESRIVLHTYTHQIEMYKRILSILSVMMEIDFNFHFLFVTKQLQNISHSARRTKIIFHDFISHFVHFNQTKYWRFVCTTRFAFFCVFILRSHFQSHRSRTIKVCECECVCRRATAL